MRKEAASPEICVSSPSTPLAWTPVGVVGYAPAEWAQFLAPA